MASIKRVLLGAALALTFGLAAAGQVNRPIAAQNAVQYPECDKGKMHQASEVSEMNLATLESADADTADALIDEYLSFHAQVVEEGGKLSLVPGSSLRTHAN